VKPYLGTPLIFFYLYKEEEFDRSVFVVGILESFGDWEVFCAAHGGKNRKVILNQTEREYIAAQPKE